MINVMTKWFSLSISFCLLAPSLHATEKSPRILSFVSSNWITMGIGVFDAAKGWVQSTDFFSPPDPGETLSIFGVEGKLGEVVNKELRRSIPEGTYAGWSVPVTRGETASQPYALVIQGSWPSAGTESVPVPLDSLEVKKIVSDYLKHHGLRVENPIITQAYQVDLFGDGRLETLITAHSDLGVLRDKEEGIVYGLTLLRTGTPEKGKTIVIAGCSYRKSVALSIDEVTRLNGPREFYRLIALHDIDGDGRKEIVLYRAKDEGTQIDVYACKGLRVRRVLLAYKSGFN